MDFFRIKDLLDVYKTTILEDDERRKIVCRIIKNKTGILLNEKDISFKKGEIEIKSDAVVKNELFIQKEKILVALQDEGQNINFLQ